jgi:hypothetical protein
VSSITDPYFYEQCAAHAAASARDFDYILQNWTYADALLFALLRTPER